MGRQAGKASTAIQIAKDRLGYTSRFVQVRRRGIAGRDRACGGGQRSASPTRSARV